MLGHFPELKEHAEPLAWVRRVTRKTRDGFGESEG
jgi:hypothetical protein